MTIALFGGIYQEYFSKYIQHLIKKLEVEHINLVVEKEFYDFLKTHIRFNKKILTFTKHEDIKDSVDCLFSIGGDGTLLKAVTYVRESEIPILGINTGRLGFISSISTDQIDDAVSDVIKNNYQINERILLELNTSNHLFKEKNFALNEVAVSKKETVESLSKKIHSLEKEFLPKTIKSVFVS